MVWITDRSRQQLDSSLRKLGHAAPFIAEGGSGVFLPEDYFHLKPERTVRLGRFTCIPVATAQPAAADALEAVAQEVDVAVVRLRSLSPRELTQNTGLSRDAAEALRQRDFDELFFFAGASDGDILRFRNQARHRKLIVRPREVLWSAAIGASLGACVSHLRRLYDRALHAHTFSIALATEPDCSDLLPLCDRGIVLLSRNVAASRPGYRNLPVPKMLPLFAANTWDTALDSIRSRQF